MNLLNLFGKSVVSMAVLAIVCGANAAQNGRDGAQNAQSGRAGMMSARMPTIPTVGITTVGNPAVTVVSQPAEVNNLPNIVPTPTPGPTPNPTPNPEPQPSECDNGGVRNSEYTIQMCMDDVLLCINNGGLQGGLNDLFCNEDVRNAVVNGMMLCQNTVDKCIREVRVDCRNIYAKSSDVWLDFDSRVVQPEYYNFVLRKTGLTPNQAKNTCLLLDRNTYGSSFASVSDTNDVNAEYDNKVGAYNGAQNGDLSKDKPQGDVVNTTGYDGNRGHYARWDACNADCLIRVAAYNKDKLITNNWLFGTLGNNEPAEVWQKTGASFVCNKDLFDMSLMNKTKTAAVVGVGGGALLGAGIGAANAANASKKCDSESNRKKLEQYFNEHSDVATKLEIYTGENFLTKRMTSSKCKTILSLWKTVAQYETAVENCKAATEENTNILSYTLKEGETLSNLTYNNGLGLVACNITGNCDKNNVSPKAQKVAEECFFRSLQKGLDSDIFCSGTPGDCVNANEITRQINEVKDLLNKIPLLGDSISKSEGALIGGVTGASVGGIVTGITALVEHNNISCRVGDGLNTVALGKSHKIDSLRDFYVKWNLNLPDTVSPTSVVSDLASWQQACSQFNHKLQDCPSVQINLVHGNTYDLVQSACVVSGSMCIVNEPVAQSHGIQ